MFVANEFSSIREHSCAIRESSILCMVAKSCTAKRMVFHMLKHVGKTRFQRWDKQNDVDHDIS